MIEQLEQLMYYSFCKSHAYSYAKMVWALAYNKFYYPKEFWLSTLNNCNTSFRKWVHYREAKKAGIKLSIGKKPWYLSGDNLVPVKPFKIKKILKKPYEQLFEYGYWINDDFLPGMYYEEYWTKLTKRHKKDEKFVILNEDKNKIMYSKFRGIIATGRVYKKEDRGFLTFLTISYKDGKYIDLILNGINKISKMYVVSGYGKLKYDGYCSYIDVLKYSRV